MFCSSCGAKIPTGVRFCFNCGFKIQNGEPSGFEQPSHQARIVPAKCTSCGASVEVDSSQESARCPFCNATYLVDKAIQNYNINVNGSLFVNGATININGRSVENLLIRAEQFAKDGNFKKAMAYFEEVLDSNAYIAEAQQGVQRINDVLNNYVYFREDTHQGIIELKKERLILRTNTDPQMYELSRIFALDIINRGFFSKEKYIQFNYSEISQRRIVIETNMAEKWFVMIEDAKMGKYPPMVNLGDLYTQEM